MYQGSFWPLSALSEKDRDDLRFALDLGVDWVGLSFVQRPEDVHAARDIVGDRAGIVAKIEKPAAIDRLREIVDAADGIMVARGDLGVELPLEEVPGLQKRIIRAARTAGKPVIVATQMLESMVKSSLPTRAEISDVATAVYDGADAVMLSAESAVGDYPIDAVTMMDRITRQVERDPLYEALVRTETTNPEATPSDAIMAAARQVAEDPQCRGCRYLHDLGIDHHAGGPRTTPRCRDHRVDDQARNRPATGLGVGRALCRSRGRSGFCRYGTAGPARSLALKESRAMAIAW